MRAVVMAAIPGQVQRGQRTRTGLGYVPYARATWEHWCREHGVLFRVLEQPLTRGALVDAPPPIQRWIAVEQLLAEAAPGSQVAVVDADTMIRWDAPDLFREAASSLAAVRDGGDPAWICRSIAAYARFFPGVTLRWWDYFNSGLVVFRREHAHLLTSLIDFYEGHRHELEAIQRQGDVGVDQTLLNFVVRQEQEPIQFLPAPFNMVRCVPPPLVALIEMESARPAAEWQGLLSRMMDLPGTFDFIEHSHVWHFTTPVAARVELMRETWRRVRAHYPDAAAVPA
jgi:hypothetical protein